MTSWKLGSPAVLVQMSVSAQREKDAGLGDPFGRRFLSVSSSHHDRGGGTGLGDGDGAIWRAV